MNLKQFRTLTKEEISQMIDQGCYCADWENIEVSEDFIPDQLRNVYFSGYNRLGCFNEEITLFNVVQMKSGIFNSRIENCIIEDNALIKNVKSNFSNVRVGKHVVIQNIDNMDEKCNLPLDSSSKIWLMSAE
jgi:hypothetical protein